MWVLLKMKPRPPLTTLLLVTLGLFSPFSVIIVESQQSPPPPSAPHSPPPPPPILPELPSPPAPRQSSPPRTHHWSPRSRHSHRKKEIRVRGVKKKKVNLNMGKKLGLLFAGIAVILQIGVVAFLAFQRRQLFKIHDR